MISGWFKLLHNIIAKYRMHKEDIYNFDKTGFMIGIITALMVVIYIERYGKAKSIQPRN